MTAKNDITGDSIKSRANNENYLNSPFWDNLEKKKKLEQSLSENQKPRTETKSSAPKA